MALTVVARQDNIPLAVVAAPQPAGRFLGWLFLNPATEQFDLQAPPTTTLGEPVGIHVEALNTTPAPQDMRLDATVTAPDGTQTPVQGPLQRVAGGALVAWQFTMTPDQVGNWLITLMLLAEVAV